MGKQLDNQVPADEAGTTDGMDAASSGSPDSAGTGQDTQTLVDQIKKDQGRLTTLNKRFEEAEAARKAAEERASELTAEVTKLSESVKQLAEGKLTAEQLAERQAEEARAAAERRDQEWRENLQQTVQSIVQDRDQERADRIALERVNALMRAGVQGDAKTVARLLPDDATEADDIEAAVAELKASVPALFGPPPAQASSAPPGTPPKTKRDTSISKVCTEVARDPTLSLQQRHAAIGAALRAKRTG